MIAESVPSAIVPKGCQPQQLLLFTSNYAPITLHY
jgi:hypothetical protein